MESDKERRARNAKAVLAKVRAKSGIKQGFFSKLNYNNSDMGGLLSSGTEEAPTPQQKLKKRRRSKVSKANAELYKQTHEAKRRRKHVKNKMQGDTKKRNGRRRCRKGYVCRKALTAAEKKARFQRIKGRVKTHLERQRKRTLSDASVICMKLKDFFHSLRQFGFK